MKKVVITGATSGIGLAIAKEMAFIGHHLILGCRNIEKAEKVQQELSLAAPECKIDVLEVDLADLSSIRDFADLMNRKYKYIDVLINNAGVFSDTKKRTKDGYELTIGTNFLGQVLLTKLILPLIKKADKGRIVNISSEAALFGRIKITDSLFTKEGKGFIAYSKSKLAQLLYNIDLAEELKDENISVNAVHPGHVATNIWKGESLLMKIIGSMNTKKNMSSEKAAKICVEVALSDEYSNKTGMFYEKDGEIAYNKRCLDNDLRRNLMQMTNRILMKK